MGNLVKRKQVSFRDMVGKRIEEFGSYFMDYKNDIYCIIVIVLDDNCFALYHIGKNGMGDKPNSEIRVGNMTMGDITITDIDVKNAITKANDSFMTCVANYLLKLNSYVLDLKVVDQYKLEFEKIKNDLNAKY